MTPTRPDKSLWVSEEEAHDSFKNGTGMGVKVAVIDSGIDFTHPQLEALRIIDNYIGVSEGSITTLEESDEACDPNGHGTASASIIHQIAPQAQIGSFRIFTGDSVQGPGRLIRHATEMAINLGYQVINLSLGVRDQLGIGRKPQFLHLYKDLADKAYCSSVHLVTACSNDDSQYREWPAHLPTCISVDKVRCGDDELLWRPGNLIEFGAKGIDVDVAWKDGTTRCVTGSSYAAPRVAGWVARILSCHPSINPPQMQALLRQVALERPHFGLHSSCQGAEL